MVCGVASNFDLMLENGEISHKMPDVQLPWKNETIWKYWALIPLRRQAAEQSVSLLKKGRLASSAPQSPPLPLVSLTSLFVAVCGEACSVVF